jgi:hypothetical protein
VRQLRRRERRVAGWVNGAADYGTTLRAVRTLDGEIDALTRALNGRDEEITC